MFIGIVLALPCTLSESLVRYQDCLGSAGALFSMFYYLLISALLTLLNWLHNGSVWTLGYFVLGICCALVAIREARFSSIVDVFRTRRIEHGESVTVFRLLD